MQVRLDTPRAGERLAGNLVHVQGWALDETSPVRKAVVLFDGIPLGRVGLMWPRPDVAETMGDPRLGLSGFARLVTLPRELRSPGSHTVEVRVRLLDGRRGRSGPVHIELPELEDPAPETFRQPARSGVGGGRLHTVWLARSLDHGGSQLRMAETVEHLADAGGWTSTVLSPFEGPLRTRLERAGARVRLIDAIPLEDPGAYLAAVNGLTRELAGADIAVAATVTSFPLTHAAALAGVPAVQRVGESAPLPTVTAWLGSQLHPQVEEHARRAFAHASLVWTHAHSVEEVYRSHGFDGSWQVVHTGRPDVASRVPREEARRLLGLPHDRRLLVFAGTIWPVKGQGLLTEAVRLVREDHPDLMVAFVGDDQHPYARELRDHLAAHRLAENVCIEPFQHDLTTWWDAADGVALTPTRESEAMSAALVEGMAHGLPALATKAGDATVMVENGRSGWLAAADDLGSLVDAVRRAGAADLPTWRAYGERAAQRCLEEQDRRAALVTVARLLHESAELS